MKPRKAQPKKITIEVAPNEVAILISGIPHLLLRRPEIVSIHGYIRTVGSRGPIYFIEIVSARGTTIADYDYRWKWEAILVALRDAQIFDSMQGDGMLPGSA